MSTGRRARVVGEVASVKTVKLRGYEKRHRFVTLRRSDGKIATVALGPKDQTTGLEIKQGTRLKALGRIGRANNRPVLLATAIEADGKTQRIRRPALLPLKKVSGQIEALRSIRMRGTEQPHLVAEVADAQGERRVIVLGPQDRLKPLKLKAGRQISLLARPVQTRSRWLWLAESVVADGREVQRSPMPAKNPPAAQKAGPNPSPDKPGAKIPPAISERQQKNRVPGESSSSDRPKDSPKKPSAKKPAKK
jgi:hypothetical protein